MGKITTGARPLTIMKNPLYQGSNYNKEYRLAQRRKNDKRKKNKGSYLLKADVEKQDFEFHDELGFLMEVKEMKIVNTLVIFSKKLYKRMDFTTVTTDEELLDGVYNILKLARKLKEFIDMPICHKDFKETAFSWQENPRFVKSYVLDTTPRKKFTKGTAIYTQSAFEVAYKKLQNVIDNFCPKKYL